MALNRSRAHATTSTKPAPEERSTFRPTGKASAPSMEPWALALQTMQEALETKMRAETQSAIDKAVSEAVAGARAVPQTPAHVRVVVQEDPEAKAFRGRAMAKMLENELTDQEIKIALMVLRGLSNEEICQVAELSIKTVKHHIGAVFRKFKVDSRAQLSARIFPVGA